MFIAATSSPFVVRVRSTTTSSPLRSDSPALTTLPCTNISSPLPSRTTNPNPFFALNHFTDARRSFRVQLELESLGATAAASEVPASRVEPREASTLMISHKVALNVFHQTPLVINLRQTRGQTLMVHYLRLYMALSFKGFAQRDVTVRVLTTLDKQRPFLFAKRMFTFKIHLKMHSLRCIHLLKRLTNYRIIWLAALLLDREIDRELIGRTIGTIGRLVVEPFAHNSA